MKLPLRLIAIKTNINFIGYKNMTFCISIILSLITVVLFCIKGLNYGIDFSEGILLELRSPSNVKVESFRRVLSHYGYNGALIQNFGTSNDILIRVQPKNISGTPAAEIKKIQEILTQELDSEIEFRKSDYVGPKVGKELVQNSVTALV